MVRVKTVHFCFCASHLFVGGGSSQKCHAEGAVDRGSVLQIAGPNKGGEGSARAWCRVLQSMGLGAQRMKCCM